MRRMVLAGAGHAHLAVLEALAGHAPPGIEVVLITSAPHQSYSGMLPGWMAGHYCLDQCRIDLQALARRAHVRLVTEPVMGLDADRRCVGLQGGGHVEYDLLSLDVGSETDVSWLELAGTRLLPVKPLDKFFDAWPGILAVAKEAPAYRLAVVGGGAAGVELALAASYAFSRVGGSARVDLLASDTGLLPAHAPGVRRRIARILARSGVHVHLQRAIGAEQGVMLADGTLLRADCVIAATGARAPCWLRPSGLRLDEQGYIAVDEFHRSLSHHDVFAAGDVCARQDATVARSGVHAVRAGPALAASLQATLTGAPLTAYRPRRRSLYLLACGAQYAVASWGGLSAQGRWVWRWKDWIDRRFVQRYAQRGRIVNSLAEQEAS